MYPVSITRSPISWASLCAITVFVSACGGNSGSVSDTPISDNPASEQVSVLPGNNEQTSEPNGTLSDGAPFEGEGNLPVAQEQAPDLSPALPVDANAEDLSEVAADLRRRFVDDARRSLLGLNNDYVSGMLEQSKFFCFDDSFPVTDYFCGGSDPAGWLTRYGSNLIGFTYNRTEVCAASRWSTQNLFTVMSGMRFIVFVRLISNFSTKFESQISMPTAIRIAAKLPTVQQAKLSTAPMKPVSGF